MAIVWSFIVAAFLLWTSGHASSTYIFGQTNRVQDAHAKAECQRNRCERSCACLIHKPKDCSQIMQNGCNSSGVYKLYPDKVSRGLNVFCDQVTDGGGWVVFQRRLNGSVNFNREWVDYKYGFGNVEGEHWLGNELMHLIIGEKAQELRVELEDFKNETRYATYRTFHISDENHLYRLLIGGYSGTAGDVLIYNNLQFSTKDKDLDDQHAAMEHEGGWWYANNGAGVTTNPNGLYGFANSGLGRQGIYWSTWEKYKPLSSTELKFRPHDVLKIK